MASALVRLASDLRALNGHLDLAVARRRKPPRMSCQSYRQRRGARSRGWGYRATTSRRRAALSI